MIIVSGQVFAVDEKVMILVQLPELAINDIKVLVAEKVCDLVDIVFIFNQSQCRQ
jgi:hypothetical protein